MSYLKSENVCEKCGNPAIDCLNSDLVHRTIRCEKCGYTVELECKEWLLTNSYFTEVNDGRQDSNC